MKKATKLIIILDVILEVFVASIGIYYLISSFKYTTINNFPLTSKILGNLSIYKIRTLGITLIFISILQIILSLNLYKKIQKAYDKSQILGISVLNIIFCGLFAGIFSLNIPEKELGCFYNKKTYHKDHRVHIL